jgi:arylsulfatase A-like enzyme
MSPRSKVVSVVLVATAALAACTSSAPETRPPAGPAPSATTPIAPPPATSSAPVAPAASSAPAPAASSAAAAPAPAARGPFNVLMISIDSMRYDMPWAGYPRDIAPNLTALYKKSTAYTHAYAISSFTSKSLGGFLGGKYPSELKRTAPFFTKYLDANKMFAESLQEQKIRTLAGQAHAYLGKGEGGFEQGFDVWKLVPGISFDYNTDPFITSQKMTPMAIEMLGDQKNTSGRFFAWFHYMDPHERYQSHEESPKFGKKARDYYDEEMFYTDLWVGKLLKWVEEQPWSKETAIVITADHGEAFGEHKIYRHAFELYEVLVHVPMFIYIPGQPARTVDAYRSHIDLVPTLFDLLGAKKDPEHRGKSFAPELFGETPDARDVICDLPEDSHNERRRAFIHDSWKIIAFANDFRYELYNLKDDPEEKDNLIKKNPDKAREMIDLYKAASRTIIEAPVKGGVTKRKP